MRHRTDEGGDVLHCEICETHPVTRDVENKPGEQDHLIGICDGDECAVAARKVIDEEPTYPGQD